MELIRSNKLPYGGTSPWAPEFHGTFLKTREGVSFCYFDEFAVVCVSDYGEWKVLIDDIRGWSVGLPNHWRLVWAGSDEWMMFNEWQAINVQTLEFYPQVPETVRLEYLRTQRPEKYYVEASFRFDDLTVSHQGQCGYACHRGEEQLWTFQGRAYLYTDMVRYGDHIYFGTAGNGGYFYELNLRTGEVVVSIKTGDTAKMVQRGHLCYVLQQDKEAKLLAVDLRDGAVVETLTLPGKAERHSAIRLIEDQIHLVTFQYSRNQLKFALWNVVKI